MLDVNQVCNVWCSGLPRTGTFSTFTALEKILPGKCHHMLRAFEGKNDPAFWTKAAKGELMDEDWKEFMRWAQNYVSIL